MGKFRFVFWVLLFSILLSIIPLLFVNGYPEIGKIFGVVLIVSLSFALWIWRGQTIKHIAFNQRVRLNTNDRFWLNSNVKFYKSLSVQEKLIFEDRLGLILSNVQIKDERGNVPDRIDAISLSALAAIFMWDLPLFVFENSQWIIIHDDKQERSKSAYIFSSIEIKEKLKKIVMLKGLNGMRISENELGCLENFLSDLNVRYNQTIPKATYENEFWNFFSKFLKESESLKRDNQN